MYIQSKSPGDHLWGITSDTVTTGVEGIKANILLGFLAALVVTAGSGIFVLLAPGSESFTLYVNLKE